MSNVKQNEGTGNQATEMPENKIGTTLTPPPVQTVSKVVAGNQESTKVVTQSKGVVVAETVIKQIESSQALAEANKVAKPQTQMALYQVVEYCAKMKPGIPQTPASAEAHQKNLMSSLFTILSAEDVNFPVVYEALLAIVRENKSLAFLPTYRNRGLNTATVASIDNRRMRFFTRIVDCLCVNAGTINVDDVKKHVDFAALLESTPNVAIRNNLTSYYSI